ncbi:NAD(P)-dependent oxidoreductase [Streptomyces sp. NPDC059816]|uniref:NAD(P)-dependent oxidoreductase n=1 Tax=Streptomyces sp. NPDC059816 TaxID=3346960 RepID=UPI00364D4326
MTATTTPRQSVTVLGLGNLGRAVAEAFLAAGHPTTVWNRTPSRADALVARGAVRAASPAEAVEASELVVVTVLDHDTARDLLAPAAAALPDRTVVNLTTSTPGPARELAAWAGAQGARYLSGAVYAVPQTIGTDEAFILYSGPEEAYGPHRAALDLLGPGTHVGTDPALAAVHDVALLSGMYGMFAGFFQAVALTRSEGIPAAALTEHLVTWLKAAADALPQFAKEIDAGEYGTQTSSLEMNAAGLRNILAATEAQGLSTDLIAPLLPLFDRQVAEGHGAQSLARAVESLT